MDLKNQSSKSHIIQRSILSLDNSNEPFQTQIHYVCEILDIQIDVKNQPSFLDEREQQKSTAYALREEWALRWLLKKFQSDDIHLGSPCVDFRAWLLFGVLAIRIPLANTARLLSTYKFMVIVANTLQWLQQKVDQEKGYSPQEREDVSVTAESSSATLEASPVEAPQKSKKRKREFTVAFPSKQFQTVAPNIEALYKSICSTIREIESFTRDLPDGLQGFSVEYMKASLKSSPQDAAVILGSSFTVTDVLIRRSDESSAEMLDEYISPMLALWNIRTDGKDDPTGHADFRAFATYCLLPLLQLLRTCQILSPSWSNTGKTIRSLDALLVKYIISPARASFSSMKRSRAGGEEITSTLYKGLLAPLANITSLREARDVSQAALFYSVAIRCIPRETPKQRTAENAWLQNLFRLLVGSDFAMPPLSPNSTDPLIRTIKSMLHEALDHNVLLDISMLETLLSIFSGLFSESSGPDIVDWDLVSLVLKINPDVFIRLSSPRQSNKFLTTMLTRITKIRFEVSMEDSHESNVITGVVIPLVQAFVHARDLPRFIEHWGKELTCYYQRLEEQAKETSIWEDSHLSQTIADFVESALTTGQLRQVLLEAQADLTLTESSETIRPLASLVILDSAISGCTSDAIIENVMGTVQHLYTSLLNLASNDRFTNIPKMWRVWRILTTINIRWSIPHATPDCKDAEDHVLRRALRLVDYDASKCNFTEELHAFYYILSFAAPEKSGTEMLQNSPCQMIRLAVETVMNHQKILIDVLIPEDTVISRRSCSAPQWNGRSNGVKSPELLIMGCQAQVLFSPEALQCLDYETIHRFFQQLFHGAVWQLVSNKEHSGPTISNDINYLKLWHRLLRSNLLTENALVAGCYRKLLISEYLTTHHVRVPEKLSSKMRHRLALESLQCIPVHAFDREERSTMSNHLLREIMETDHDTVTTASAISLILKIIAMPSKSIDVLNKLNELSDEQPLRKGDTGGAFLVSLAHNLDDNPSEIHHAALSGLKQLTQQILKYQMLKLRKRNSVNYLTDFYRCIAQEVNSEIKPHGGCASAVLVTASLDFYLQYRNELPKTLNEPLKSLPGLRQRHLERLHNDLCIYCSGVISELRTREALCITLECMISSVDLICVASRLAEVSSQLSLIAQELLELRTSGTLKGSAGMESNADQLSMCLTKLAFLLETHGSELTHQLPIAKKSLASLQSLRRKRQFLQSFSDARLKSKPEAQVQSLLALTSMENYGPLDTDNLLLLQNLVSTYKDPTQQAELATVALSRVFIALCIELPRRVELDSCILTMQCMRMLLQKQPQTISQWNIDNTLTAITIVSFRLESATCGKHTGIIYLSLCRLLGTLLAAHRKKLGGRYHLVVPALQGLLRLLFVAYASRTPSIESYLMDEGSLGKAHAAAYARLLTTLCSPTVSAVAKSRNNTRQDLNDETKKARSIAGQHLPYVIMDYCTCQLKGRLLPEVRTALGPGLYAVLDVMQPELMRTMNAAMDSTSRSVFKALYEQYRRLGNGRRS